jgi:copper homeostasis protein
LILEICVFNITDVILAKNGGADRIELCASYIEGGITPSHALITETFKYVDPENIVVMIRPRGGDFIYDDYEFEVMRNDIQHCKKLGVKNVIFGISLPDGKLNAKRNKELIDLAAPMHCTLQRAFDLTPDPMEALHSAINCGFKRILTSGQQASVMEGKELIKKLIDAAGNQIDILPGAGITSKNADELIRYTNCREIHTSAKMYAPVNHNFREGIYDFSHLTMVNEEDVKLLKEITNRY